MAVSGLNMKKLISRNAYVSPDIKISEIHNSNAIKMSKQVEEPRDCWEVVGSALK